MSSINTKILFDKISSIQGYRVKHKKSLVNSLMDFQIELNDLNNEFNKGKVYKSEYIISLLYSSKNISEKSINLYCRINLYVAANSFNTLIDKIRKTDDQLTNKNILLYKDLIRDYIFDLIPFITTLKRKKDPNYIFFDGGKNYSNHTFEIFTIAYHLQYSSSIKEKFLNQKISNNLCLFTLRQSLELRFRNCVGIGEIFDSLFESPKLRHDFFPNFVKQNKDIIDTPYSNLSYIIFVYKWTNYFIHYGLTPRVWDVNFCITYANSIFEPKDFITKSGKRIWSVDGAIIIKDLESLRSRFIKYFNHEVKGDKIYCIEFSKPNAIIDE